MDAIKDAGKARKRADGLKAAEDARSELKEKLLATAKSERMALKTAPKI